jgi:phage shock protein PspC (stress-responsive transcriptional regulator)
MAARQGLHRSQDRMLAGVCGGIAEWLDWSPTSVRILYVLISLLSAAFPGILVYLLLWFLMPDAEDWVEEPPG